MQKRKKQYLHYHKKIENLPEQIIESRGSDRGYSENNFSQILKDNENIEVIAWEAPEFGYNPKDFQWRLISLLAALILILFAFWQKDILFALFLIIAWLVFLYFADRFPSIWRFRLDETGISISSFSGEVAKFYSYKDLDGFDIHDGDEEYKELVIKLKTTFSSFVKINIHTIDEEKINNFLIKFIPRKEFNVSLVDVLAKLIRF
jgi:hypothetical protein